MERGISGSKLSPMAQRRIARGFRFDPSSTKLRVHSIDVGPEPEDYNAFEHLQVCDFNDSFNFSVSSKSTSPKKPWTDQDKNNYFVENDDMKLSADSNEQNVSPMRISSIYSKKMEREREIFLRAALQLLQQEARAETSRTTESSTVADVSEHSNSSSHHQTERRMSLGIHVTPRFSGFQKKKVSPGEIPQDIFRYGFLKKAPGHSFAPLKHPWKSKYVFVKFGKFEYYEDVAHYLARMSRGSQGQNSPTSSHHKAIVLSRGCRCRAVRLKTLPPTVFELTDAAGKSRLFMASSEIERDAWVATIRLATLGSVDESLGLEAESPSHDDLDGLLSVTMPQELGRESERTQSWEGPASSFAAEIAKYATIRELVREAETVGMYARILERLHRRRTVVTVPVFYVKCQSSKDGGAFAFCPQDVLTKKTLLSVETSQIWKDLSRDSVIISSSSDNEELIRGVDQGTEAMVGALMRHIMDRVDDIRSLDGLRSSSSRRSIKDPNKFEITEAQVLACARDLLILCNRTQSGGDTYFCLDAMLSDKEKGLVVIVPTSTSEPDPIEIYVDIVRADSVDVHASASHLADKDKGSAHISRSSSFTARSGRDRANSVRFADDDNVSERDSVDMSEADDRLPPVLQSPPVGIFQSLDDLAVSGATDRPYLKIEKKFHTVDDAAENVDEVEDSFATSPPERRRTHSLISSFIHKTFTPRKSTDDRPAESLSMFRRGSAPREPENKSTFAIRIEVIVRSKYKLCDADPQDDNASFAEALCDFQQLFFIKSKCAGRPVVSDRLVTIEIDRHSSSS